MKSFAMFLGVAVSTTAMADKFQPASFIGFQIDKAKNPIVEKSKAEKNSRSENSDSVKTLYKIVLNPFFIQEILSHDASENTHKKLIAKNGTSMEIPSSYLEAAQIFAAEYEIENYYFLGPLQPAVHVWLDKKTANQVRLDEKISSIAEMEAISTMKMSAANPPIIHNDLNPGNGYETVSWGINAISASNAINNQYNNTIYVVDAHPKGIHPNIANDLNYTFVIDAATELGNYYQPDQKYHLAHIMGIIGAKSNGQNVIGVNPGQPIRVISATTGAISPTADDILQSPIEDVTKRQNIEIGIDLAALDAEKNGLFSVLNVSFNDSDFNYYSHVGMATRRASNRLLVVESAGNDSQDACTHAYNRTQDNDGIVVVGGIKQGGTIFTSSDNGFTGFPNDPMTGLPVPAIGSNYGPCVELWAPGYNITSLDFYDGGKRVSTGTSFAAPFTAAVASRWGDNSTRPIIREQLLKAHAYSGTPGRLVKYGTLYQSRASTLLPISKITQEGSNADIPRLRNAKYYDPSELFRFPGQSGSLIVDLGTAKFVKGVRLTLITSAEGNGVNAANFTVLGSNDMTNFFAVGSASDARVTNWGPIYVSGNNSSYRYLKITGTNPISPLGYSEVEVYGR